MVGTGNGGSESHVSSDASCHMTSPADGLASVREGVTLVPFRVGVTLPGVARFLNLCSFGVVGSCFMLHFIDDYTQTLCVGCYKNYICCCIFLFSKYIFFNIQSLECKYNKL